MSPTTPTPTMQAWTFTRRGLPSQVLTLNNIPAPTAATLEAHDLLIQVSHSGMLQGIAALMAMIPHVKSTPWIPGHDFSGIVAATGSKVVDFTVGDRVFGSPDPKGFLVAPARYNGVMAQYAVVPEGMVVKMSADADEKEMVRVAGLTCNACTAVQFAERCRMREGHRVLVTGASGGLGTLVTQVVKSVVGSEGLVVATCSAANEDLVKGLGVDEVIDYRAHPQLHAYLTERYSSKPFDIIIDIAGSDDLLYAKSPAYLIPDGTFLNGGNMSVMHGGAGFLAIVSYVIRINLQTMWPLVLGGTPRRGLFHSATINPETVQKVAVLYRKGQLKGVVDSVYEMQDVVKAFDRVASGRVRGKVVVHVQDV